MELEYSIQENFLDQKTHDKICRVFFSSGLKDRHAFPYRLSVGVSYPKANDGIYFFHSFYRNNEPSKYFPIIKKVFLEKLSVKHLFRCDLNFYPQTAERIYHGWHVDSSQPHKGMIYYLNTNNGQTQLKSDNDAIIEVESISRSALFFDPSKNHRSTTCTDAPFRSNIIINYI